MADNNFDVVIIGAGLSGLTAAYNIKKRHPESRIVVLEGKDRVGGRTLTVPLASANGTDYWDLGGQWVGTSQVHIMKLLHELGLKTYPQYIQGLKLQQLGETKIRSYTSEIPSLSLMALIDLHLFITKIERYQAQLSIHDPYSHPKAKKWDAMSIAAFSEKTLYTQGARAASETAVRSILGCEGSQISFLYYLLYVRMAGGLKNLIEATDNTAQSSKIQGGAQQISKLLAEHVGLESVRLGDPVTSISQTESNVVVLTAKGWRASAEYVIVAMPPQAIEHIAFTPRLSEVRVDFMKHMPMGSMIKIILTYEKAFWKDKNLSGQIVSNGGNVTAAGCVLGPLCITYDATTFGGSPALVGFLGGSSAVNWADQMAKARQEAVLKHLADFFGPEVYTFLDYIEKNWTDEPCSWGAPVSYVTPGGVKHFARAIRRSEGRLLFAGTETATSWSGYMSGAVQAGERSAIDVLYRLKPSALSEADIVSVKQAMAYDKKFSFSEGTLTKSGNKTAVMAICSFSLGLGLASVTVYIVIRCLSKGEAFHGWVRQITQS